MWARRAASQIAYPQFIGLGDRWDLSKSHCPGGLKPAMTRDDSALEINQDWIGKPKRLTP
jgi:hypothetical protein